MQQTAVWRDWEVRHIATHCNGSKYKKIRIFVTALAKVIIELLFRPPDVIHIHTSSRASFIRKCILTWVGTPFKVAIIIHVHGSEFDLFYEHSPRFLQMIIRKTLQRADAVVALGDNWASRLITIAPRANIAVLPNGIRVSTPANQTDLERINVVFIGEIGDRKGAFRLLEAWSRLPATTKARLTVAGDGDALRAQSLVRRLGMSDTVDVTGWISPQEVQSLLANAHVLVLPSLNEGQPIAILEAMARGLCVVASRTGGIPDLLGESAGVLIDPRSETELVEALTLVTHDHDVRRRLAEAAYTRAQTNFDIDLVSDRLSSLYVSIVGQRPGPRCRTAAL